MSPNEPCPSRHSTRDDIRCTLPAGHQGKHQPGYCCPVPGCGLGRKGNQIMCRTHWFRVPKAARDRIWALVRGGGLLSSEYLDARAEAIAQAHLWVPKRKATEAA